MLIQLILVLRISNKRETIDNWMWVSQSMVIRMHDLFSRLSGTFPIGKVEEELEKQRKITTERVSRAKRVSNLFENKFADDGG